MNIVMMTNTYLPHVGGVAHSVHAFAEVYRAMGHVVTVIAPEFQNMPRDDAHVLRVPAIQNFNGSDFSVSLPVSALLANEIKPLRPDIIHSHHPFLLGDTALRVSATLGRPLVFTYHTMYEYYTHYVPADSEPMRRFAKQLAISYCNLCEHVIAPSESVRQILRQRGLRTPVSVVPTGIDGARFSAGAGEAFRRAHGIPARAFVAGHVGRLAPEKNGEFLAVALADFVARDPARHRAVVVGDGPSAGSMRRVFERAGFADRAVFAGKLTGGDLADAYQAMNVFAFASKTETQGMVLAEAMAAGIPVVALDAPGARDIVRDGRNGWLIAEDDRAAFVRALVRLAQCPPSEYEVVRAEARRTAQDVSIRKCAARALKVYETVLTDWSSDSQRDYSTWDAVRARLKQEWEIWGGRISALENAITDSDGAEPRRR